MAVNPTSFSIILTRPTFHGHLITNVVLATTNVASKPKAKFAKENLKSLLKSEKREEVISECDD